MFVLVFSQGVGLLLMVLVCYLYYFCVSGIVLDIYPIIPSLLPQERKTNRQDQNPTIDLPFFLMHLNLRCRWKPECHFNPSITITMS